LDAGSTAKDSRPAECPLTISLLPLQWPTAESERLGVTLWRNVSKTNWRFSRGSSVLKIVV